MIGERPSKVDEMDSCTQFETNSNALVECILGDKPEVVKFHARSEVD